MLRHKSQNGFTIVELLIVIVVIAILAAITIVAYSGVTQKAHTATLKSDLANGNTTLGAYNATNGSYPSDQSNAGLKASPGDTLTYMVSSDGTTAWCLQATGWNMTYAISSSSSVPSVGWCAGTGVATGPVPIVSTLAGNGSRGYVDGSATSAEFDYPEGDAVDASNNIYIGDDNNCIRKITPSGVVSTFAGTCAADHSTAGYADGTGAAAKFNYPNGLAFDSSGNLYVADNGNDCIRKITPAAAVSTFAGSCGTTGSTNGTGTAARFNWPWGIAVDASNNIYVADYNNSCIRKITPAQVVTNFYCGLRIYGLAVDSSGNVFAADPGNCIVKLSPTAILSVFAGGDCTGPPSTWPDGAYADGTGTAARFTYPWGLAISSSGNLYLADEGNNCIRKISPAAVVTTLAGACSSAWPSVNQGYVDGPGATAQFGGSLEGVAVGSDGNLYVVDSSNNVIRKIVNI